MVTTIITIKTIVTGYSLKNMHLATLKDELTRAEGIGKSSGFNFPAPKCFTVVVQTFIVSIDLTIC